MCMIRVAITEVNVYGMFLLFATLRGGGEPPDVPVGDTVLGGGVERYVGRQEVTMMNVAVSWTPRVLVVLQIDGCEVQVCSSATSREFCSFPTAIFVAVNSFEPSPFPSQAIHETRIYSGYCEGRCPFGFGYPPSQQTQSARA